MIAELTENRRILVIDDNEMIHRDFEKILTPALARSPSLDELASRLFSDAVAASAASHDRFELSFASQGEEGLRLVCAARESRTPFALAFIDMRMPPGWDGLETITRIWHEDPDLQIVICTAYSDHSWEQIVERIGCSQRLLILKKPFDPIEVLQLAHALTDKWSVACTLQSHMRELERIVAERTKEVVRANDDLRQSVAQLATMKAKIEQILHGLPLILLSVTNEERVGHWNAVADRSFGISSREALAKPLAELPVPWELDKILPLIAVARAGGEPTEAEIPYQRPDGQDGFLMVSASRMPESDGEVLIFAADVTRRKTLEMKAANGRKLEAIGQLAAGISHEINTPTQYVGDNLRFLGDSFAEILILFKEYQRLSASLRGNAAALDLVSLLDRFEHVADVSYLSEEIPKALRQSSEGIQQISKIVSAMRDFSHVGPSERKWANINSLIETTLDVSRSEYKLIADIELRLDPAIPRISCAPTELNQVFLNLIVNSAHAIRASVARGARGTITITTIASPGWVEIRIADTGHGIPEGIRDRIFEPFFTTKPVGQGTGQGLYLSHDIVEKGHGGSLAFESIAGVGTTFIVRLPATGELAAQADPVAMPGHAS